MSRQATHKSRDRKGALDSGRRQTLPYGRGSDWGLHPSRQYAVEVVGVDFSAPDGERQVPEVVGKKTGVQTAVEHEHAAAPVDLRVEQFAADGQTVEHSVVIQAADHDGIPGAGQRRRI